MKRPYLLALGRTGLVEVLQASPDVRHILTDESDDERDDPVLF
jgi:hypothetical protein